MIPPCAAITTHAPQQTLELGRAIGKSATGGVVIGLCGALGAGKTQLVKGIALGLGVAEDEPVVSPTFVLVREYRGRLRLLHGDAYRLADAAELWELGLAEALEAGDTVIVLEWADRVRAALPDDTWWIEAEHRGPAARHYRFALPDTPAAAGLCDTLRELAIDRPPEDADTTPGR